MPNYGDPILLLKSLIQLNDDRRNVRNLRYRIRFVHIKRIIF